MNRDISYNFNTPILFLVFNRPLITSLVFESIRKIKPPKLYIASDGPRRYKENEINLVLSVRKIVENIDWPCELYTLYREENLGCKVAVGSAISWFFQNEDFGIILEDDCLPSLSFFRFCEELLYKYKDDDSVYLVSGDSRGADSIGMREDYGFCKYPMIWGWASWARVWKNYDSEIKDWPIQKKSLIPKISNFKSTRIFWKNVFDKMYLKEIDTWDYQFSFLLLKNGGKCIIPKVNLVSNIGFGDDATHTFNSQSSSSNRRRFEMDFPLVHSPNTESEKLLNDFYDRNEFYTHHVLIRIINKITRIFIGRNSFL